MAKVPQFVVVPPMRCADRSPDPLSPPCARRATWERSSKSGGMSEFRCELHRRPGDVPIAPGLLFRRVSVQLEVLLAATSESPNVAHTEAVELLRGEIERIGGVVSLVSVTSLVGQGASSTPSRGG